MSAMRRFPDPRGEPHRPGLVSRLLFIVARNEDELLEELRRSFAGIPRVEIVVDRRQGQRRRSAHGAQIERRQQDRRAAPPLDTRLATMGWAVAHRI
jgi:hypothetical protein